MSGIPEHIRPCTVDREIGRGGMGVVYLAHDTNLDRAVVIKTLPAEVTGDAERLGRFEREARLPATLNHQNIAAVFGRGSERRPAELRVYQDADGLARRQKETGSDRHTRIVEDPGAALSRSLARGSLHRGDGTN
ncbi:MAG: hypothetical protein IID28_06920 [Planctomycetes bacterium]|nr:hypothetical protein [Planctomycetota bacterium]